MTIPNITIGCDPEVFVSVPPGKAAMNKAKKAYDEHLNWAKAWNERIRQEKLRWASFVNEPTFEEFLKREDALPLFKRPFRSAHDLIPGTKKEPFKVEGGAIQVDGVALEFNIDPASTAQEFSSRIKLVLDQMREKMGHPELQFEFEPTATFSPAVWKKIPDEAKVLGCEPDYNGYTLEANPKPTTTKPFRTAAGHIHVGWTSGKDTGDGAHVNDCGLVAKQLDMILGMWSPGWDNDDNRRQLYGNPGAFRVKPYGMEYRPLSNRWLAYPEMYEKIFNNAKLAVKLLFKGKYLPALYPEITQTIQEDGFKHAYYSGIAAEMAYWLGKKGWEEMDEGPY